MVDEGGGEGGEGDEGGSDAGGEISLLGGWAWWMDGVVEGGGG